jgi:hypothetical protein
MKWEVRTAPFSGSRFHHAPDRKTARRSQFRAQGMRQSARSDRRCRVFRVLPVRLHRNSIQPPGYRAAWGRALHRQALEKKYCGAFATSWIKRLAHAVVVELRLVRYAAGEESCRSSRDVEGVNLLSPTLRRGTRSSRHYLLHLPPTLSSLPSPFNSIVIESFFPSNRNSTACVGSPWRY